MNRLEIDNDLCANCAQPIHRHTGGTAWSHDLMMHSLECHKAEPSSLRTGNTTANLPQTNVRTQ